MGWAAANQLGDPDRNSIRRIESWQAWQGEDIKHSQLEQCAVGVAVGVLLLALLGQVRLEGGYGFRVVALKTVDDVGDVLRPLGRVFAVHLGLWSR